MQQQIFTKDFIFDRIKDSNAPYWYLSLCQGFKNVANVMNYNGVDFLDDDTDETRIEKSIEQLKRTISTFPEDSVFIIELRGALTASRNGVFGPFQFVNSNNTQSKQTEEATQTQTILGVPQGYVPESALKGLEDSLTRNFNAKILEMQTEFDRKQRETEFARREKELDEREKELKEMKKEYDSSVAKATDVLFGVGKKIVSTFFVPPTADNSQLGTSQMSHNETASDDKADAVDDFAAYLYNNFSLDDINNLKNKVQNGSII